ncbi:MAG TPA: LOG family protein, partial [Methylomirabilota bacterium]|nr:LOG family protein [Methylomirabilota bacterium]
AKPLGLLNVERYWDPLVTLLRHAAGEGFVRVDDLGWIMTAAEASDLLEQLASWKPATEPRAWLSSSQT